MPGHDLAASNRWQTVGIRDAQAVLVLATFPARAYSKFLRQTTVDPLCIGTCLFSCWPLSRIQHRKIERLGRSPQDNRSRFAGSRLTDSPTDSPRELFESEQEVEYAWRSTMLRQPRVLLRIRFPAQKAPMVRSQATRRDGVPEESRRTPERRKHFCDRRWQERHRGTD
jgi:hypothetical protein